MAAGSRVTIRQYDARAVQRLLAHRYPFLLVDQIDVIVPGEYVIGAKRLTSIEWWASATPDRAFPFVLALEALAQTGGALLEGLTEGAESAVGYFVSADHVRFRQQAYAGDTLRLEVRLRQWKRGICRTHGIASVDGRVVTTAELTTVVRKTA